MVWNIYTEGYFKLLHHGEKHGGVYVKFGQGKCRDLDRLRKLTFRRGEGVVVPFQKKGSLGGRFHGFHFLPPVGIHLLTEKGGADSLFAYGLQTENLDALFTETTDAVDFAPYPIPQDSLDGLVEEMSDIPELYDHARAFLREHPEVPFPIAFGSLLYTYFLEEISDVSEASARKRSVKTYVKLSEKFCDRP